MKYSFNWLKELSGTKLSAEKVADLLTMHSFELEGMENKAQKFEGIVVGKILEIEKHPNADKLQLTKIDIGKEKLQIVCGAWNIKVGDRVPLALIGTKLANGLEIKEASIRGEKSFGMLCAEDELGLGKDHSGILILDKKAKVGENIGKYLNVKKEDSVFEIKVLPDRAHDAMSHVGVAREICALENRKFDYDFAGLKLPKKKTNNLKVEIKDKKLCSRYIGALMAGVKIKPSPKWMQDRLKSCGINVINNVVDATNYIMLELGQPLHAFDRDKLENNKISVRRAKNGEEINLLDKGMQKLTSNDLLITSNEKPAALAGIKGARIAEIDEATKNIVLEAAAFDATNIRRTRARLNIRTESSDRFEKEIDPNLAEKALTRVIEILEKIAEGKLEGVVDIYPKKISNWKINLDLNYLRNLLGEKIATKEVVKILSLIEMKVKTKKEKLEVEVPTFRIDLKTPEDLIEEIGRIWGYEKIEPKPLLEPVLPAKANEILSLERKIREKLANFGFDEMYNYSFYSRREAEICGLENVKHYELANPMNPDQEMVRASMAPNILKNIKENIKNFEEFDIFEIGRTYSLEDKEVKERRILFAAQIFNNSQKEAFYFSKGNLENFLESFGIKDKVAYKKNDFLSKNFWCDSSRSAKIEINGKIIGYVGEFNSLVLGKYKIKKQVGFFDMDIEKLLEVLPKTKKFKPINKFPEVVRDISMIVPKNVSYFEIEKNILQSGGDLVENVSLFDYFQDKNSLAVRISMNGKTKTLENAEIDEVMEKIISNLEEALKIEIRK